MHDQKQIYSLRKLSVGLASVIVGTCFFISTNRQNVQADTLNVGEQPTSTVIQQDSSEKQEQGSNEQNDQTNVSNSKTEQQQSINERNDVENVESNLNDTNKLDDATKPVESEANQKFDQVKDKFKQDTSIDADVPSSVTKDVKKIQTNTLKVVKESTVNPNSLSLKESKAVNLNNNGGFDSSWGTLDVNNWKGNVQGDYYQLTDYTGDANHIIVPNESDFAKAGISTSGKQVGVTRDLMHTIFRDKTTAQDATVAFSKTDNKMVKAINTNWNNAWGHAYEFINGEWSYSKGKLTKFDGSNLDVANVTDMGSMFNGNQINDVSSLSSWKTDNVTNMQYMFYNNQISDLSSLSNWNTDKVTFMWAMFTGNQINDLIPLANWKTDDVTGMSWMFDNNVTTQTKNIPAKRVINFVYPEGYTGKKQATITQTVNVPQKVKVELVTKYSKPSNNILDWVTKTETPISTLTDPVYFQAYTVPTVSNLVPNISTVAKQEADPDMPLNVVVTYTVAPVTVHFKDVDENADKDSDAVKNVLNQTMQLSGTYGSKVDLNNVKLPANFVIDDMLPSVQYGKTDSVTINLKHYINDVKAENAEDATRTIVIKKFNGHGNLVSTQTVVQQIAFYKHDYVDAVTNKVKSSKYIFDDKSSPALSHNVIDGKATNDPSYVLQNGKYYFAKYKVDVPAGYKAKKHVDKINPNLLTISLFALPTTLTDPNTSQTVDPDANKGSKTDDHKSDTSSSFVTDKANNSHDLHDDSKKQNDQPIISNNKTDHTINVSAQAVDPTVEPEKNNVASQNNSTTSAQTQQSSTNDAEQLENIPSDRVVNDQTDDFADSSREENDNSKAPENASDWSKPKAGKITHVNSKTPQNGLNEAVRGQSVATHPATTSVINNFKSDSKQLPQTGEKDNYTYSALGLLLGLNVAISAVGVEKKRKKY